MDTRASRRFTGADSAWYPTTCSMRTHSAACIAARAVGHPEVIMRLLRDTVLSLASLLAIHCTSTASRQPDCLTRASATWNTAAAALNRYANCRQRQLACLDRTIGAVSTFTVWQGVCTATLDVAAQNAILTNAQQL